MGVLETKQKGDVVRGGQAEEEATRPESARHPSYKTVLLLVQFASGPRGNNGGPGRIGAHALGPPAKSGVHLT